MISPQDLSEAFARNVRIVKMQAEGLTQQDSLRHLPSGGNCLNWVLGHITVSRNGVLDALGEPPIRNAALLRYQRDSEPVTETGEDTLPVEEILHWLDATQERIAAALSQMDETAFSQERTSGGRPTTLGQRMFFLYFHESYHVGQTEVFRQLAGRNEKLI